MKVGCWAELVKASHGGAQQECGLPVGEALSRVSVSGMSWHWFACGGAPMRALGVLLMLSSPGRRLNIRECTAAG